MMNKVKWYHYLGEMPNGWYVVGRVVEYSDEVQYGELLQVKDGDLYDDYGDLVTEFDEWDRDCGCNWRVEYPRTATDARTDLWFVKQN